MDVSNRIRKLTDHISMYTQEAEKDNSRGRETYKPLKSSPSALLPLKWLHLQRFHSLPKEFHQVGTICSNTRAHDIIFKYKSPWYNISHLYHNTSTYLALYFKRFFCPISLLSRNKYERKKAGKQPYLSIVDIHFPEKSNQKPYWGGSISSKIQIEINSFNPSV